MVVRATEGQRSWEQLELGWEGFPEEVSLGLQPARGEGTSRAELEAEYRARGTARAKALGQGQCGILLEVGKTGRGWITPPCAADLRSHPRRRGRT